MRTVCLRSNCIQAQTFRLQVRPPAKETKHHQVQNNNSHNLIATFQNSLLAMPAMPNISYPWPMLLFEEPPPCHYSGRSRQKNTTETLINKENPCLTAPGMGWVIPTWKPRGFTDELSSHSHFRTSLRCTRTLEWIKDGDLGTPTVSLKKTHGTPGGRLRISLFKNPQPQFKNHRRNGKRMPWAQPTR